MAENVKQGSSGQPGDRKKRFLLVVDGNAADLYTTGMLLQRLDYYIYSSNTAEDALQVMTVAQPSAVISEIGLSKMNGIELLRQIKQDPRTQNIPFIVLTAVRDLQIRDVCVGLGCAAYLFKPVEPNTLYRVIQNAVEPTPRQYIRLKICLPVDLGNASADGKAGGDCVTALSENGMYVNTLNPKPVGTILPAKISLPGREIAVEGVVLYSYSFGQGPTREPGMGIKFVRISPQDQALLKDFIQNQVMIGLSPR